MRAETRLTVRCRLIMRALPLVALALGSACSKEVKAEFPRPPASSAVEPSEEEPIPLLTEDSPKLDESVAKVLPEVADPVVSKPVRREAALPRRSAPSPEPSEVAPPPPPSTQLARSEELDPAVVSKLRRAERLLGTVEVRTLSAEREEQLTAARAFLLQARIALADGDDRRAIVLIDKGLILAEDVERASRP